MHFEKPKIAGSFSRIEPQTGKFPRLPDRRNDHIYPLPLEPKKSFARNAHLLAVWLAVETIVEARGEAQLRAQACFDRILQRTFARNRSHHELINESIRQSE